MSKWYFIIAVLSVLAAGSVVVYKTRGIRNNNPGNIRHGAQWQGMARIQADNEFVQFIDPIYGIRALNRVLRTYATSYGLNSVRAIINRWAPPNENDTDSYVLAVAQRLGVQPDQDINVQGYAPQLTRAIIKHENGVQPYSDDQINTGVSLGWA